MRIGSTIHLFKGYCYNSYKWNYLRPFCNFKNILKSLDELKIDEILVLRPIKGFDSYNFLAAKLAYKIISYSFEFKKTI